MMLRYEEDETDDDRHDDDRPTERVSWEPRDECDEEIIYRLIDERRDEPPERSWDVTRE
jgi:hypothetical protein